MHKYCNIVQFLFWIIKLLAQIRDFVHVIWPLKGKIFLPVKRGKMNNVVR